MSHYNIDSIIMQHNEEKPQNTQQLKGGTSRRSRKVQEGRDFICGCGKKYLSYPALYTHIKTKHQGKMPQGTDKTGSKAPTKKNKPKQEQQFLKSMLGSLQKKDLTILNHIENCEGFVPLSYRVRKEDFPKQIYQCYHLYHTRGYDLRLQKSSCPIEVALLVFIVNTGQFVNDKVYTLFIHFAKIIRSFYLEHGQQIYQTVFKERAVNSPIFSLANCQYLPIIVDFIVRFYVDVQHQQIDNELLAIFLFDLSKWMKSQNITCLDIKYKKDIKKTFSINSWKSLIKNNYRKKEVNHEDGEPEKQNSLKSDELSDQNQDLNLKERQNNEQSQQQASFDNNIKQDEPQIQQNQAQENQAQQQQDQQHSNAQKGNLEKNLNQQQPLLKSIDGNLDEN